MRQGDADFKPGTRVFHARRGRGVVLGRWGSWWVCRECHLEVDEPRYFFCIWCQAYTRGEPVLPGILKCRKCGEETPGRLLYCACAHCRGKQYALQISGSEIYEVKFKDETAPVHRCWLEEKEKAK